MNGMFGQINAPIMTPEQAMANVGQSQAEGITGMLGKVFNLQTPQQRVTDIIKGVDPSSPESLQQGFRDMLNISPQAAFQYVEKIKPLIDATKKPQLSLSDLRTQQLINKETQENRANQLVGLMGTPTDYSGAVQALNLLDNQGLTNTSVYKGLKEDIRNYSKKIGTTVTDTETTKAKNVVSDFVKQGPLDAFLDFMYTKGLENQKALPTTIANYDYWNNEDNLAGFVASYAKAYKTTPESVIKGVLDGTIDPNKALSPPSNINNQSSITQSNTVYTEQPKSPAAKKLKPNTY